MTAGRRPEEWAEGDDVDVGAALGWPRGLVGRVWGRGQRGVTVRARQPGGDEVAIKVGPSIVGDRARRRWADDAAPLQAIEAGRHLSRPIASGVGPEGHPWRVAPWFDGGSLADQLASGPLTAEQVADAAAGTGLGLAELHRQGVLHAAVRPGNLLVGPDGGIVVAGMAVVERADPAADPVPPAAPLDLAARLAHVPPEVLEGRPWTVAGDIWALGSCLHTLVSGRPPWAREATEGPSALVLAMATGRPPGLRPAGTPAWLSSLIDGCLAVDEAARPADGSTIAALARHRVDDRLETVLPEAGPSEGRPLGSSYLLDSELGSGSSGLVWRGHRRWDHKPVAVKVLRPELASDPDAVARFLRERTTLVGLDHPNLVPIMDLVAEGTTLAIVMELVEGSDLRQLLRAEGALDPVEAFQLLAQAAAGMAAVHRAGIVHRDLKPENILVQGAGATRTARVTDFGIARAASGTNVTRTDQLIGTVEYLAPELVAGRPVTAAADVYSLGVLGYELLCGQRPFDADHPAAMLQAHLEREPAPLGGLPDGPRDLLAQAMAKDPAVRPTASELADRLATLAPQLRGAEVRRLAAPPPTDLVPGAATDIGFTRAGLVSAPREPEAVADREDRSWPPPPRREDPGPEGPARPTEQWSSWRSTSVAPRDTTALEQPRSRKVPVLIGVVSVVVVGVVVGVVIALTHHAKALANAQYVDVTSNVTVAPTDQPSKGVVKLTWSDVAGQPGFVTYVLFRDKTADPSSSQLRGTTSVVLTDEDQGYRCYRIVAVFDGALPPDLPRSLGAGEECTTVP